MFGSGPVARARATALLDAGATVTVVARPYEEGDLAGAFLAVAATGDAAETARIFAEAEREGVLLNAVDDPAHCHFAVPAVLRRGDLTVTVSTGGRAPGYARRLRDELGRTVGAEYGTLVDLIGDVRAELRAQRPDGADFDQWAARLARRPRARPDRSGAGGADGRGPDAAAGRAGRRRVEGGRGVTAIIDPPELGTRRSSTRRPWPTSRSSNGSSPSTRPGELDEDRWRVFRLANGIYGQRQGGTNQMVRVKIPYGSLRSRAARDAGHHRPGVLPGLGSHHDAPERPVPFRGAGTDPGRHARPGLGRADDAGGVRRHGPQRGRLPPGRRLPLRGARHQPLGGGGVPPLPPPSLRTAPPPQVQDQLLRLRHRLRPGDVQRHRRRGRDPGPARRHHRSRVPRVHRRRARRHAASGPGAGGVHVPGRPAGHAGGGPAGLRPFREPRQQAPGPDEVACRHAGHRRAAGPRVQGAPPAAGRRRVGPGGFLPWSRRRATSPPASPRPASRRARPARRRSGFPVIPGHCRTPGRWQPVRPLGAGQRGAGRRPGHRVGLRPLPPRRHHRRAARRPRCACSAGSAPRCG